MAIVNPQVDSHILDSNVNKNVEITVCVSLYNYQEYIIETLESIYCQTLKSIDLIIVDDCSSDWSNTIVKTWLQYRSDRFNSARLIKHNQNKGLSASRNTAIEASKTPFVFMIDADNLLYPRCLEACLEVLQDSDAAFAYPILEKFGEYQGIAGNLIWNVDRLAKSNYIDAMALIRKTSLQQAGGYSYMPYGWEDYDLWCKFSEQNAYGILVPEILAKYRVHKSSMLNAVTNKLENLNLIVSDMCERHPWLELKS